MYACNIMLTTTLLYMYSYTSLFNSQAFFANTLSFCHIGIHVSKNTYKCVSCITICLVSHTKLRIMTLKERTLNH